MTRNEKIKWAINQLNDDNLNIHYTKDYASFLYFDREFILGVRDYQEFKDNGLEIVQSDSGGIMCKFVDSEVAPEQLIDAIKNENKELVIRLINNGADVNAKDNDGIPTIMWALLELSCKRADIAHLLIDRGADVNAKDNDGNTALMWAARRGRVEVAQFLIDRGADVNTKNNDGDTALINAARCRHINMVQLLLDSGADIDVRNNNGDTALDIAKMWKNDSIVELLEQHCAE